ASGRGGQAPADAVGKIRAIACRLRGGGDARAAAQLIEGKRGVDDTCGVDVTVDEPVQHVAKVEAANPTRGIGVADDVDGAAVAQQMVELRAVGELVDALDVDE